MIKISAGRVKRFALSGCGKIKISAGARSIVSY